MLNSDACSDERSLVQKKIFTQQFNSDLDKFALLLITWFKFSVKLLFS